MTLLVLSKRICPHTTRLLTMLDMMKITYDHCVVENTTSELIKEKISKGPAVFNKKGYVGTYEDLTSSYLRGTINDLIQEND